MAAFPASLNLSSLTPTTGFRINGAGPDDTSGFSVSAAGDVNGDGFDDFIVGAPLAGPNSDYSGSSYVVFGRAGGFDAPVDLGSLTPAIGFRIDGEAADDQSGQSVSSAGDVNGDGLDDVIIGVSSADPNGRTSAGSSYVVFGRRGGFDAPVDLGSLTPATGFRIDGAAAGDQSGISVSSAGDVNGDGIDDIIVGGPYANPNGNSGSSYVVFGREGGFDAPVDLGSLTPATGFRIDGAAGGDYSGLSVSVAGDVNGDGLDDLIVGAPYADPNGAYSGSSFVVFGREGGFDAPVNLGSLTPTTGFRIDGAAEGDRSGRSVSAAGDVNGDGFADLIVGAFGADANGADSGSSYVVFGRRGGFDAPIDLASLTPATGIRFDGAAAYDFSGRSVSGAGDVNGDGFDDLIVGARGADPNGDTSGSSFVVFGRADGFDAPVDLGSLDGTNGFRINGAAPYDYSGRSVSAAGDVNGDGFDDLIVGAPYADPNGSASGSSYVVFGRAPDAAVTRTGTDIANTIRGGAFNDRLIGLGGDDQLIGGAGNDALVGGAGADRLEGGDGIDTAVYTGSDVGVFINLEFGIAQNGEAQNDTLTGIENIQGSAFDDTLGGDDGANALFGLNGDDQLKGGGGADRLDGGLGIDEMFGDDGDDRFLVDDAGDTVFEDDGEGSDTVFVSAAEWTLQSGSAVEFLRVNTGTGVALTGNELDQFIYGAQGDDRLDGGGGSDRLYGGAGDDTYVIGADSRAVVIENADAGTDTVEAGISFTLRSNVENLTLTGTGDLRGNGNAGANVITGNAGANVLSGGAGDDVLIGSLGADRLTGGAGADTFAFRSVTDSTVAVAGRDLILGFSQTEGDRLDLSAIDANLGVAGDQAFTFIGAGGFSGAAGEVRAMRTGSYTLIEADVDGVGGADFAVLLQGVITLTQNDFVL